MKLTQKELEVCKLLSKDIDANTIASRLKKPIQTIQLHIDTAINKIGCNSENGIVCYMVELETNNTNS